MEDNIISSDNKGMILVLEDAESVLLKRDTFGDAQGTSNILNLTSGLLNDIFGIQIIATYNTNDKNIDPAIQRSKRLIAKRMFNKLCVEDTKKLAENIGVEENIINELKEGKTVADIYSLLSHDLDDILIDKSDIEKSKGNFFN
jgi:hypothetical protein